MDDENKWSIAPKLLNNLHASSLSLYQSDASCSCCFATVFVYFKKRLMKNTREK